MSTPSEIAEAANKHAAQRKRNFYRNLDPIIAQRKELTTTLLEQIDITPFLHDSFKAHEVANYCHDIKTQHTTYVALIENNNRDFLDPEDADTKLQYSPKVIEDHNKSVTKEGEKFLKNAQGTRIQLRFAQANLSFTSRKRKSTYHDYRYEIRYRS